MVKYLNQGASGVIKSRREDAYKKMYSACNGKYKIENEGPHAEGGAVVAMSPGTAIVASSEYWFIQFSCVK
jgi:hypothetical protein